MGITKKQFEEIINLGVDVVTMGNHTWGKKEIFTFIDNPKIIRPAKYPSGVSGRGYNIFTCMDKKIAVINLIRKDRYKCFNRKPIFSMQKNTKIIKRKRCKYHNS